MKVARNYKVGGAVVVPPIDPPIDNPELPTEGSKIVTLELTYTTDAAAQAANVSFAKVKYNKAYALNFQKDDGYSSDMMVYNYFQKGLDPYGNSVNIPTYSDGCGNALKFKYSFAVFPLGNNGSDLHTSANPTYTNWDEYAEIIRNGHTIMNHSLGGLDSTYGDRQYQIKGCEKYIYDKMKERGLEYRVKTLVVPDTQDGFATSCMNLGYRAVCSTFGGGANDGQWPIIKTGSQIRLDNISITTTPLITRMHFGDNWTDVGVLNSAKDFVNDLFRHSDGNQTNMPGDYMRIGFSHGPGESSEMANFIELMEYIVNHPQNSNNIWVPSMDEFTDYYFTKEQVTKSSVIQGNKVLITLDTSNVEHNTRFLDMSLLAGSGLITVTVDGAERHSFNPSTGLINIFKKRVRFSDPELDIVPPRIINAVINTSTPNNLVLSYDRPVTQSITNAYSVDGTTVTGITGSGTTWILTLANNMNQSGNQLQFYYKCHIGNATDAINSNLKVCAYHRGYVNFQ